MRPIDADATLKALRKCQTYLYDARDPELKIELSSAEAAINNLPTIQPVATDTNVGDTISRRAAIDTVSVGAELLRRVLDEVDLVGAEREKYEWGLGLIESCISDIKELPPAQPEPQEGHWIDKGCNGDWAWQIDGRGNCWRVIECSECGKRVLVESNYCPHCGAKMTISTK